MKKIPMLFTIEPDLKEKLIDERSDTLVPVSARLNKIIKDYFKNKEGAISSS